MMSWMRWSWCPPASRWLAPQLEVDVLLAVAVVMLAEVVMSLLVVMQAVLQDVHQP